LLNLYILLFKVNTIVLTNLKKGYITFLKILLYATKYFYIILKFS